MGNKGPLFPISSIVDWIDFLQLFLYCRRSALLRLGPLATYGWCHERGSLFVFFLENVPTVQNFLHKCYIPEGD